MGLEADMFLTFFKIVIHKGAINVLLPTFLKYFPTYIPSLLKEIVICYKIHSTKAIKPLLRSA